MTKCSVKDCSFEKHDKYQECILHCSKKEMSSMHNPYFTEPEKFYNHLLEYVLSEAFKSQKESQHISKNTLEKYINKQDITHGENNAKFLKNQKIVFTNISFPNTDSREHYMYLSLLQKLGNIWFNYCSFYISSLELVSIECFFQDCTFHEYWNLYDYKASQSLENLELYNACIFHEDVTASGKKKEKYILNYVQFNGCTFHKDLNFESIEAKKAIFNDWTGFESQIQHLKIHDSSFESRYVLNNYVIESVDIVNSVFIEKFEFKDNVVSKFNIDNSNFEKLAEFYNTTFEVFKLFKSIFTDYTGFEKCKFGSKINPLEEGYIAKFTYITFLSFINFRNTNFYSGLSLEDTNLKESPNFLNTNISFKNTTRETFRIIKHSFDKIGNHIEANKFFSLEMNKYKEKLFKSKGNRQEKIVFWFNEKISNFGQNYVRPIILLIISASLFAGLFYSYTHRWLYGIVPEYNVYITNVADFFNAWAHGYLPFSKFFVPGMELISLFFYLINLILLWQIVVSVKRHTKR